MVSTEASEKIPSTIPPHVNVITKLEELINLFLEEREDRKRQFEKMAEIVSKKLEEIAADNGSLARGSVENIMKAEFETMRQNMESSIHKTIKDSLESAGFKISHQDESGNAITSNTTSNTS